MSDVQVNTELKKTKEMMAVLLACAKDKEIPANERKDYYKDYLTASAYYLKLSQIKPTHNLSIA